MIKLFDLENSRVIPSVHCYNIAWLKVIVDKHGDEAIKVFSYIFYMTYTGEENPYSNITDLELRDEKVLDDLDINFSMQTPEILTALKKASELYDTPTIRAYRAISTMLDNMSEYMETAKITAGRDGNITALTRIAEKFDAIRQSYKGVAKDLAEEQKTITRGNQALAYDQTR
jgi:hypothetical protein